MARWPRYLILITAVPLFALGVAEVVVGTMVFNFTSNLKIGAWYVGVLAIVNALLGFLSSSYPSLSAIYPVMCIATAIVALIGTLIDGIWYAIIGYLKACGSDGVSYWGDSAYYGDVYESCDLPKNSRDCYCVISHSSPCFSFEGNGKDTFDQDNCDPLIDGYGKLVLQSWSICLALFFFCWIIFFIGCCACCGNMFSTPEAKAPLPLAVGVPQPNPLVPGDISYQQHDIEKSEPSAPPM